MIRQVETYYNMWTRNKCQLTHLFHLLPFNTCCLLVLFAAIQARYHHHNQHRLCFIYWNELHCILPCRTNLSWLEECISIFIRKVIAPVQQKISLPPHLTLLPSPPPTENLSLDSLCTKKNSASLHWIFSFILTHSHIFSLFPSVRRHDTAVRRWWWAMGLCIICTYIYAMYIWYI